MAKGYSIEGKEFQKEINLKDAFKEMLDHKGSYLLEVMVGKENNVFPDGAAGLQRCGNKIELNP